VKVLFVSPLRRRAACALVAAAGLLVARGGRADEPLANSLILGPARPYSIDSIFTRYTHLDQNGHGYQSQAGPSTFPRVNPGDPGSEYLTVEQPQVVITAHQGERITHTLWLPVDVVTAASPDALDAVSTASRTNEAAALQLASSYAATRTTSVGVAGGFHFEEQFRSWNVGAVFARSFAEDNSVLALSVNEVFDWFDKFDIHGDRLGRTARSSTNANIGLTQLLSPSTVAHVDYGVTLQAGTLGNTWNSVPIHVPTLPAGSVGDELLPSFRQRHAFSGRLVQWLPWRGALHASYRFYVDDWGLQAHSVEAQLYQRLTRWLYVRATYRVHQQNGVSFFTTLALSTDSPRTADSDLAPFVAQTVGGMVAFDLDMVPRLRALHLEVGYERYWRTNDLAVDIYTGAVGIRF
jgi:hypothetical protein